MSLSNSCRDAAPPILPGTEELRFSEINGVANLEERVGAVAKFIKNNCTYQEVVVDRCLAIEDEKGKKKILEAILTCPCIKRLGVTFSTIGVAAADIRLIGQWVARAINQMNLDKVILDAVFVEAEARSIARALRYKRTIKTVFIFKGVSHKSLYVESVAHSLRLRSSLRILGLPLSDSLSQNALTSLGEALQQPCSPVTNLGFSVHSSPDALTTTLRALHSSKVVKVLIIQDDSDASDDHESIGSATVDFLRENTSVKHLIISRHPGPNTHPIINIADIGQSLAMNQSLGTLSFKGVCLRTHGIQVQVPSSFENNSLKSLSFRNAEMDVESIKSICDIAAHARAIKRLVLSNCGIIDEMVFYICKALVDHGSVQTLDLSNIGSLDQGNNSFGDESCQHIRELLRQNQVLKRVRLRSNRQITDAGVKALIEGVKVHPTVTTIKVDNEHISATTKNELNYFLDLNTGPKKLLSASPPLPLSLWPRAFKRADACRGQGDDLKAPDMLYFLVKAKVDLFNGSPVQQPKPKRRRRRK